MKDTTNEMTMSMVMPATIGAVVPADTALANAAADCEYDDCITDVEPPAQYEHVSVFAESITSSGTYDASNPLAHFDVVFNVGITIGQSSSTYRVVKTIAVDKQKIAKQASVGSPTTVVEDKKVGTTIDVKRMRFLAGLE